MSDPIFEYNSFIKLLEGWDLFMYDKKIAYLHYIKNGELIGNAGHVKVTQRGNMVNIEVYVREAYGILNGCYYIQNLGGSPFEHKINIEGGQAVFKKRIETGKAERKAVSAIDPESPDTDMGHKNEKESLPYGLKIEIEKGEYLEAVWRTKEERGGETPIAMKENGGFSGSWETVGQPGGRMGTRAAEKPEENQYMAGYEDEAGNGSQEKKVWTDTWDRAEKFAGIDPAKQEAQQPYAETFYEKEARRENGQSRLVSGETASGNISQREKTTEKQPYQERHTEVRPEENNFNRQEGGTWKNLTFSVPVETYEDKWNELCKKYEVIHPFGNREEYLSLSPKDFIIFPEKYQHLVNNSFLLHGYYNYRHVILGKKEEGGKNIYYLGVPGVYYEREKMVAIMFGFEGFECGEKRALAGGFGYYMRRVEL